MKRNIVGKRAPGIFLCGIIAAISSSFGNHIPLVGGPVFALLFGILLNLFMGIQPVFRKGLDFTASTLLKVAIILLGFGLSIDHVLQVGKVSLAVMVFTLAASFGFGALFGRLLNMDWKLSSLISAGTGICGGSAIAALSPVIGAQDSDITYSIAATFIFDIGMVLLFPLMGHKLGLSDFAYGLWTGTAVNDTSSVVAAGYAYSNLAGDFATIVKLTRTLSIVPTVIIFSLIASYKEEKGSYAREKTCVRDIFPFFIVWFLLATFFNSFHLVPLGGEAILKDLSKFFMVMALAAIGLKTDFDEVKNAGFLPMFHGFIISAIVVVVSLGVQTFLGQV